MDDKLCFHQRYPDDVITVEKRDEFLRKYGIGFFDENGKWHPSSDMAKPMVDDMVDRSKKSSRDALSRAAAYVGKMPPAIAGQHGHHATFAVARELVVGFDLTIAEATPIMADYNARCQPPWTEHDLLRKLREADQNKRGLNRGYRLNARNDGRKIPDWIEADDDEMAPPTPKEHYEFPLDIFPPMLQEFAKEVARSTDASLDFAACSMLAMAGTCIGSSRALAVKARNWHEMPRLYMAIVAEPGSTKSPTLKIIYKPMYALQKKYDADHVERMKVYAKNIRDWEAWKKGGNPPVCGTEKPEEPVHKDIYSSDATTEKLIQMLRDNPRGVTLVLDEVVTLVRGMNQYKQGGKGTDRQFYLSAWSGMPVKNDRKSQHGLPGSVEHPYVGVIGGIQPQIVKDLAKEDGGDDGLIPRFLYTYPNDHVPGNWDEFDVTDASDYAWSMTCERLLSLRMEEQENGPRPHLVRMSREAKAAWATWYNAHAIERRRNSNQHLKGALSKLIAYNARLILIVHLIRWTHDEVCDANEVDSISVMMGCQLTEYFKHNYKKICDLVSQDSSDQQAETLSKWIASQEGGRATTAQVTKYHIAGIRKKSEAMMAFKDLEDRGLGTFGTGKSKRGRDFGWFRVAQQEQQEQHNASQM